MKQKKQKRTLNNIKKLLLNTFPIKKYIVYGHSMMPSYPPNTHVIVSSIPYLFKQPSIDDVVVAKMNNTYVLKRITSLKENNYFLEGDNKNDSFDSESFGYVEKKSIVGKVIMKIAP